MITSLVSDVDHILTAPETQDEGVWKYEHLRQFCMELNGLAVKLQSECKPETCSQMTATEQWIFLCAAHKTPKECPAIDYTRYVSGLFRFLMKVRCSVLIVLSGTLWMVLRVS